MANETLPQDGRGRTMQLTPSRTSLASAVTSSISASATLTINAATTFMRCYAKTQDVYLKWGSTAVTNSNFDEVIPAGQIVDLVVPDESLNTKYITCRIIEAAATATFVTIQK